MNTQPYASDDSSFFRPSAASLSQHAPFTKPSFRHLNVFAYIALGVVISISSFVLCYALYSCLRPPAGSSIISIGGAYSGHSTHQHRLAQQDNSTSSKRAFRWFSLLWRDGRDDDATAEKASSPGSFSGKALLPPHRAQIRDVPHIRIHPPMSSKIPSSSSDSMRPGRTRKILASSDQSGRSWNITGLTAPSLQQPKAARAIGGSARTDASFKLFPITDALPMSRAASNDRSRP